MEIMNYLKRKVTERDFWLRLSAIMGTEAEKTQSEWNNKINTINENTGQTKGSIREYIVQMSIVGVMDKNLIVFLGIGFFNAMFVTQNKIDGGIATLSRAIGVGLLSKRQLSFFGLDEQDVINVTGSTVNEFNEKLKNMNSNQRAGLIALLLNDKYGM